MSQIPQAERCPTCGRPAGRPRRVSEPSARDLEVLDRIVRYCRSRFVPPTVEELLRDFDWASGNAVAEHLRPLRAAGLVEPAINRHAHTPRSIRPLWGPGLCRVCGRPAEEGSPPAVPDCGLSDRQAALWTLVRDLHARQGRPASIRELAAAQGKASWRSVQDVLVRLLRRGAVSAHGLAHKRTYTVATVLGCPACGRPAEP